MHSLEYQLSIKSILYAMCVCVWRVCRGMPRQRPYREQREKFMKTNFYLYLCVLVFHKFANSNFSLIDSHLNNNIIVHSFLCAANEIFLRFFFSSSSLVIFFFCFIIWMKSLFFITKITIKYFGICILILWVCSLSLSLCRLSSVIQMNQLNAHGNPSRWYDCWIVKQMGFPV